ncbi:hypothetical protein CP532_5513 [Ophiocordyceps camponoti-leonardi (nom. inval.)]|nr:hypothetical protein CP532_5513 [Ophiocordyceps camponoti-leonardi (nom. inval.)]
MQFTAAVILAVAAVASAASDKGIKELPYCAQHCVTDAAQGHTNCEGALDCLCDNVHTLAVQAADCVIESCGKETSIHDVLPKAMDICVAHKKNYARQVECVPVQVATQTSAQVVTTTVGPRPTASVVTAGAGAVGPAGGLAALAVAAALL